MKRVFHPWILLFITGSAWGGDDLPVTVLPPVTTVAEESSASPSQPVVSSQPDFGIELPPVDMSVLKAAKLQAAASNGFVA